MLFNNEWVKNEIREEIENFLETNENKLTTIPNLGSSLQYLKKVETFQTNNLTLRLQELEE